MRLASFIHDGKPRIGVVLKDGMLDLAQVTPKLPPTMKQFLAAGDQAMDIARKAADMDGPRIPFGEFRLRPPISQPGKILAIGLNYKDHVEEGGRELPKHQIWFNKQHNAINGPAGNIVAPAVSDLLDYEGELCFVIGKRCRHVPKARAHEVIAGYMVGNDVSVRDWQKRSPTMQMGKSFDTHAPTGPWIVTPDEIGDPQNLGLKTWVNDELRQDANTSQMLFDIGDQIEHLTQAFTLDPGDIIFTGTPAGVGFAMDPPGYVKPGDVVRIEIEKVGSIQNKVIEEIVQTVIG